VRRGRSWREFDLLHVRNLLVHVDAPRALANVVAALRPGGRLLVEEGDFGTAHLVYPAVDALERYWNALATAIEGAGGDPYIGRKLPHLVRHAGLTDIEATAAIPIQLTEDAYVGTIEQVAPVLVGAGLISADDVATIAALPRGEDSFLFGLIGMAVWGRKPPEV
jgi:plasmid stabilization system protein ParE